MRGFCVKCREYRSDNGEDGWLIVWNEGFPFCERCHSIVELWDGGG